MQDGFRQYRRKGKIAELRPVQDGETAESLSHLNVSISPGDYDAGSPKKGDMIARNPDNHGDKWLVSATYFAENFEPNPL
jgi:hypothetical protein